MKTRVVIGDPFLVNGITRHQTFLLPRDTRAKLDRTSPEDPEFEQIISTVIEDGRAHIAYEQDTVCPVVRDSLSQSGLDELGEKIAKAKKSASTRPHPRIPSSPGVLRSVGATATAVDKARDAATGCGDH